MIQLSQITYDQVISKLSEPDSLKVLIPVGIGVFAALITAISTFTVALTTHFLGNRSEIKKLRVAKAYELAEKMAQLLEKIEGRYAYLDEFWKKNLSHISSFPEAAAAFERNDSLYTSEREVMKLLAVDRKSLNELLVGSWLYLPKKISDSVKAYVDVGNFSHMRDGIGLINDYTEQFFRTLSEKQKERKSKFEAAAKKLRKLKV